MFRPHLLGVDDGPFHKGRGEPVPVVAVMMEGAELVEGVAVQQLPEDGDRPEAFLADWISILRLREALHGLVLGGITIGGLGVIDVPELSVRLGLPVLVVNRSWPSDEPLIRALIAAGLDRRVEIVLRTPRAFALPGGTFAAQSGTTDEDAARLLAASTGKSLLPEPLRLAHLFAAALANGESRGRP